jgi:hypothetical protein
LISFAYTYNITQSACVVNNFLKYFSFSFFRAIPGPQIWGAREKRSAPVQQTTSALMQAAKRRGQHNTPDVVCNL